MVVNFLQMTLNELNRIYVSAKFLFHEWHSTRSRPDHYILVFYRFANSVNGFFLEDKQIYLIAEHLYVTL